MNPMFKLSVHVHTIDPKHLLKWLFSRLFYTPLVSFTRLRVIMWWQESLGADGKFATQLLQVSQKSLVWDKINLIQLMDFASVKLFSATYPGLHLARKCITIIITNLQTNCQATFQTAELHSSHGHEIHHHMWLFILIMWTNSACNGLKKGHFKRHLRSIAALFPDAFLFLWGKWACKRRKL